MFNLKYCLIGEGELTEIKNVCNFCMYPSFIDGNNVLEVEVYENGNYERYEIENVERFESA